jgi:predicted transcriptional regulator
MHNIVNNPVFNEFVYSALFNATVEEKRRLKPKYFKIAMSARSAKTFCTTGSKEEKEYMLAELGYDNFYVICRRGMTLLKFKEILAKFDNQKRVAAISDIAEAGVFVTSDREFMRMLGLMSQSIHHHSHFLNLEITRQGHHIQRWSKQYLNKKDIDTKETDASAKALARTCLSAILTMTFWPGSTGMTTAQMEILLYLYSVSNSYISYSRLFDVFAGNTNNFKFSSAIRALVTDELIIKHGRGNIKEYSISALGIKQVNTFINKTINLNSF